MNTDSLSKLELLRGLKEGALTIVATRGITRSAKADDVLWSAGTEPKGIAIVLSGEVRVVQSLRGRLRVVHIETVGGTLGEVPVFAGGRYPATAIASRATSLLIIPRSVLFDAISADPTLAFRLLERVAGRLRHVLQHFESVQSLNVTLRLGVFFLTRYQAVGHNPVTLGSTQQNVAEEIGTVREVLVRSLRELRELGLAVPAGKGKYDVDVAALEKYVEAAGQI